MCIYSLCCENTLSWMYALGQHHVNQNGLLTIPGVLGLSAGLWVKLPLWLVETVCDFLLLRPMASIDWLLLRMTRYREKWGDTLSQLIHVDNVSEYLTKLIVQTGFSDPEPCYRFNTSDGPPTHQEPFLTLLFHLSKYIYDINFGFSVSRR